jgi:hypothetical protein
LKNTYLINLRKFPGSPDSFCPVLVFCTCHTIWHPAGTMSYLWPGNSFLYN